jgi:hypothetical protein
MLMEHDPTPVYPEGEYGVINLTDSWHVASLFCFVAALGSRYLVEGVPRDLLPLPRFMMSGIFVLIFAAIGIGLGLIGLRRARNSGPAKLAIFLNATVLALGSLATLVFFYIMPN